MKYDFTPSKLTFHYPNLSVVDFVPWSYFKTLSVEKALSITAHYVTKLLANT